MSGERERASVGWTDARTDWPELERVRPYASDCSPEASTATARVWHCGRAGGRANSISPFNKRTDGRRGQKHEGKDIRASTSSSLPFSASFATKVRRRRLARSLACRGAVCLPKDSPLQDKGCRMCTYGFARVRYARLNYNERGWQHASAHLLEDSTDSEMFLDSLSLSLSLIGPSSPPFFRLAPAVRAHYSVKTTADWLPGCLPAILLLLLLRPGLQTGRERRKKHCTVVIYCRLSLQPELSFPLLCSQQGLNWRCHVA